VQPGPCKLHHGSVVQDIMTGLVLAGATRHIVAAAAAAIVRAVAPTPDGDRAHDDPAVVEEVKERLDALAPAISAQVCAAIPLHSSKGLVDASTHIRANAARHQFNHEKPFAEVSIKEIGRLQRSSRDNPHSSASEQSERPGLVDAWANLVVRKMVSVPSRPREFFPDISPVYFQLGPPSGRWVPLNNPQDGTRVRVARHVETIDELPAVLPPGLKGFIINVDEDGDAQAFFPAIGPDCALKWIAEDSFKRFEMFVEAPE
jgi:hypothetical protein